MATNQESNYDGNVIVTIGEDAEKPEEAEKAEEVVKAIVKGADEAKFRSSATIYRVPQQLRKLNENAYTPRLVSIGPFHCEAAHLKAHMQDIKMLYVNDLLCRIPTNGQAVIDQCLAAMEELKVDARKVYAEEVQALLDGKMLVIDGCFILELLYRKRPATDTEKPEKDCGNDPILGNRLTFYSVQLDLLLLENQLPLFVLEKLFQLTLVPILARSCSSSPEKDCGNHLSLTDYIRHFFGDMPQFDGKINLEKGYSGEPKYHHILHLLHSCCIPDKSKDHSDGPPKKVTKSAAELVYAGIKFEPSTGKGPSNINFDGKHRSPLSWCRRARFEIPRLLVDDRTETLFRNLIALEQGCSGVYPYFTSYACLMDALINTPNDVAVLQKNEVICNYLGDEKKASELFNTLCKEVDIGRRHVAAYEEAVKYSNDCWPKTIAYPRRKYFATPWTFIAFCVAFILFGITVTQFIRSFLR